MRVLSLHGLGQSASAWEPVIEQLPMYKDYLSAFDLFSSLSEKEGVTLDVLDRQLSEKIKAIQEPFVLCGLSLGAILTLKQAIRTNPFLKGIIVAAPQFETPNRLLLSFQNTVFRFLPQKSFTQFGLEKKQALQLMNSLSSLEMRNEVTGIHLPTLIICGEKDKANLPAANTLASLISNSQLKVIENGKHELNTELPILFAEQIHFFLNQLETNSS